MTYSPCDISLRALGFDTDILEYRHHAGTYRCTIRHVEGAIFHLTQEGFVDDDSVVRMISFFQTIRRELDLRFGLKSCVVINEIPRVTGGSIYAKRYLKEYFFRWPGLRVIGVGGSGLINIVGKVLALLVPSVSIRMVRTIEEALRLARSCDPARNSASTEIPGGVRPILPASHEERFAQLLEAVGRVTWDESFETKSYDIPEDDPFFDLFAAIRTMHEDIREIVERIETARKAAEDAVGQKDRLVADVSHELRSPLTGIVLLADLLRTAEDHGEAMRHAAKMRDAALRMTRMVDGILESSRLGAGKGTLLPEPFDLRCELVSLCDRFSLEAAAKGLRFETKMTDAISRRVIGDPVKVTQVLTNLLGNAIKYTDIGFVSLSADLIPEGDRARVVVEVADSGVGIAPEDQKALFDRFSRGAAAADRRRAGVGLGLSIARELARLMGGEVFLSSEPGEGSVFTFIFTVESGDTLPTGESLLDTPLSRTIPRGQVSF